MLTSINIDSLHGERTCVTVQMTAEQIEEFVEALHYILSGGKTVYLQDEAVLLQFKEHSSWTCDNGACIYDAGCCDGTWCRANEYQERKEAEAMTALDNQEDEEDPMDIMNIGMPPIRTRHHWHCGLCGYVTSEDTYEKAVDARKRHGEDCGKHPGWGWRTTSPKSPKE